MSSTKFMSLLLATIFALIFSLINGAILEKRRFVFLGNPGNLSGISPPDNASSPDVNSPSLVPEVVIAAVQENAAIPGIQALPTSSVMSPASSQITDPPPSGSAGCVPWATCNVFYPVRNPPYATKHNADLIDHSLSTCITGLKDHKTLLVFRQTHLSLLVFLIY